MWNCIWKFLRRHQAEVVAFATAAQAVFALVLMIATCLLVWYNYGLLRAMKEDSDISRRVLELQYMSQVGVTNLAVTVGKRHHAKFSLPMSYRFQVEELAGAATELKSVETYISPNQRLSSDGLYQCHDVDAGFILDSRGNDKYTVEKNQVNLSFRRDGTATEHDVYLYIRLTHRDIASEKDRYQLDGRLIRFNNEGHVEQSPIVRPPESVIHRMFDQKQGGPC